MLASTCLGDHHPRFSIADCHLIARYKCVNHMLSIMSYHTWIGLKPKTYYTSTPLPAGQRDRQTTDGQTSWGANVFYDTGKRPEGQMTRGANISLPVSVMHVCVYDACIVNHSPVLWPPGFYRDQYIALFYLLAIFTRSRQCRATWIYLGVFI